MTRTLADGSTTCEQWRLVTSLTDHHRYPASELVELYHERWQAETTYFSIKATLLDGRVLRSRSLDGLDQEVYALLTVYQALIHAAADAAHDRPALDLDRISFTVLLTTAREQAVLAQGIVPAPGPTALVGTIGRVALNALQPARRRLRAKARPRKNPGSKYSPNTGQHPQHAQTYTISTKITYFEKGLATRPRR
ncbi:transposase [Streptomyces sp. RGM 3693]|uniref:transposase n=1 Tax=Streptomyces sp. RGM 3693 TaxID=3413284 RepID=UPI003D2CD424